MFCEFQIDVGLLRKLLFLALVQNRANFVELFTEYGADFDDYKKPSKLIELYNEVNYNNFKFCWG